MSGYGESRWQSECLACCEDCSSCLRGDNNNEDLHCVYSKRFVTVGSVRYGLRLGAVSPPPPGAGPRYRSQCCWPSTLVGNGPGRVSRIPLLTAASINNPDIFKCVNRLRMAEDATSDLPERVSGHDQLLNSAKFALKNQLRRRALVRPQDYSRLFDYGEVEGATLDRLPRFRFGGNRGNSKGRERDKRNEQRPREIPERYKKQPVPPPRIKHVSARVPQTPDPVASDDAAHRTLPLRSASFSQVDYSADDGKYVRRRQIPVCDGVQVATPEDNFCRGSLTLPRSKATNTRSDSPNATTTNEQQSSVNDLYNIIYRDCKDDEVKQSLVQITNELSELKHVDEEPVTKPRNSSTSTDDGSSLKAQEKKRDKSKRRKGIYISQWPNPYQQVGSLIPQFGEDGNFPMCSDADSVELRSGSNVEIPKLKISEVQPDSFNIWSSPQEEPLSPEENNTIPEWTNINYSARPSEEKEKESVFLTSRNNQLLRADSLSESEHDQNDRKLDQLATHSDISDCESRTSVGNELTSPHVPRRYSKRPLRGPYGQMLEAEMKKPEADRKQQYSNDLKFLEDLSTGNVTSLSPSSSIGGGDPKPKYSGRTRDASNHSLDESQLKNSAHGTTGKLNQPVVKRKVSAGSVGVGGGNDGTENEQKHLISHQRTTSSPSKLEGFASTEVTSELLEQLLRGSSEQLAAEANQQRTNDTRTHVVVELYDTERSYVESLQILVTKYLEPLKSPENAGLLDAVLVDEIFYQIPSLLAHHQLFLDELKKRLEQWDVNQKVGDVFLDMFSKPVVIENYTNYVNHWKRARDIIKNAQQSKPAFARFLEAMAREHRGKLALDSLLIKPIQKFPKYELLLQRLIKHTDTSHPDHGLLLAAQKEVHEQLLRINCTEKEALELEQLREIEGLIEGLIDLVSSERQYLRHDMVSMAAGGGTRKERALFLFSDLLLVTSIKRRSGTMRRPPTGPGSVTSTFEANKYKLLMKIALDDLEIVRTKDENLRQMMVEMENLTEDIGILNQINELSWSLHCNHGTLEDVVKDMLTSLSKQLSEQQNSDSQLSCLDLTLSTSNGLENISIVFSKPDKRASWEEAFHEAKHKLAISGDRRPSPELVAAVPIRKTRAGLQFTCAAPTSDNGKDVWVCNSDGYVGQVCVLSLHPEPTVTSCNGVCNARILCIVAVPGVSSGSSVVNSKENVSRIIDIEEPRPHSSHTTIQFDSGSSSDEYDRSDGDDDDPNKIKVAKSPETVSIESDETDTHQSTMWLGTEDGCIHVYNSGDNIRIKKNKIKIQHGYAVLCIIYLDNRVFVSLANGDVLIYERDSGGAWNINGPMTVAVGSSSMPVSKMLPNGEKLWCGCGNVIKVFNTRSLTTETSFVVNNDSNKHITSIVLFGNGVWLSLQNSAIVKCFHASSLEHLCEINVAPAVTKMLTSCDDIIRQHKAACLRVTALLACRDLLWVGTSAGVLLTMPLPHITLTTTRLSNIPPVVGVPHGHTGHVRFLTYVDLQNASAEGSHQHHQRHSYKGKPEQRNNSKVLVISGGDGYEDFRSSNVSEVAGREDSTNHLLLWNI